MATYYHSLGVSPDAEPEVIQAAYHALMRKYHPDVERSSDARAKQINVAYAILSDPSRRAAYDADVGLGRLRRPAQGAPLASARPRWAARPEPPAESLNRYRLWTLGAAVVAAGVYFTTTAPVQRAPPAPAQPAAPATALAAGTPRARESPVDVPGPPPLQVQPGPIILAEALSAQPPLQTVRSPSTPAPRPPASAAAKAGAAPAAPARPGIDELSPADRDSVESACSGAAAIEGPAAHGRCVEGQLAALAAIPRRPTLDGLSADERSSIESACSGAKAMLGPASYYRCVSRQVAALDRAGRRRPDLAGLSAEEQDSIERVCSPAKATKGPAAYYGCVRTKVAALR